MWITGRHPVEELLSSGRQKAVRVLLSESVPPEAGKRLLQLAGSIGIPCVTAPRDEWERRTGDRGGAGFAAEIAEYRYLELREWLDSLPGCAIAFLLDGITDPQNFGAILRNARAFGVGGVISPKDRSCPVTPAVFRASAGAAAHVPVVQVANLARAAENMKESGFWVYAAEGDGETDIFDLKPPARTGIVLGSEERGVRKLIREKCDGSVRIPMARGVDSLNVGVTSGIFAFFLGKHLTSPD